MRRRFGRMASNPNLIAYLILFPFINILIDGALHGSRIPWWSAALSILVADVTAFVLAYIGANYRVKGEDES